MKYDSERGIVRVDHKLAKQAREILNRNGTEMKIKTVRTSGTLKGLEKE
jgi:RNase P/RNase MRP subunit POP5|tara:strand:+ start:293 stop:439 length:147 start_codon:yes stop_codon:yes gene_type:complete